MVISEGNEKKETKRAQTLAKTMIPKKYRSPVSRFGAKDFRFCSWEVEEYMVSFSMVGTEHISICMEILSIQEEIGIWSDGLLCMHSKGGCRDPETEHGIHIPSYSPKHTYKAQINCSKLNHPIWQHQLPQGNWLGLFASISNREISNRPLNFLSMYQTCAGYCSGNNSWHSH